MVLIIGFFIYLPFVRKVDALNYVQEQGESINQMEEDLADETKGHIIFKQKMKRRNMSILKKEFLWGGAVAAHQLEGGW